MAAEPFVLAPETRSEIDRLGQEFLAGFYAAALERRPRSLELLAELAHAYAGLGRIAESLELDKALVAELPESPLARYNLACSLALSGAADDACSELERAIELGYRDVDHLLADDDLVALRGRTRFEELVQRLRKLAAEEP
jgi:hypothetical protein